MRSSDRVLALYDQPLASIGERSAEIEPRPLVSHWSHVGSAYRGLVIVGQALRGWPDDWQASQARTAEGRQQILSMTRARNADRPDPFIGMVLRNPTAERPKEPPVLQPTALMLPSASSPVSLLMPLRAR